MQQLAELVLQLQSVNKQSTFLLSPISWQTYESLFEDLDKDKSKFPIYFSLGVLAEREISVVLNQIFSRKPDWFLKLIRFISLLV